MAVVGGTHFPVKSDTIAQTCPPRPPRLVSNPHSNGTTHHGDTCAGPVLLLRTRGKVQVHVYRGIRNPQRILRVLIGDAKIIRVRLDPAERELRALLDNLHGHHKIKTPPLP